MAERPPRDSKRLRRRPRTRATSGEADGPKGRRPARGRARLRRRPGKLARGRGRGAGSSDARRKAAAERKRKAREEAARIAALTPLEAPHLKGWPWSEGSMTGNRKKKPALIAVTNDNCTGCAGSPVCISYCPVNECMYWIDDEDHPPFGRIEVDAQTCIGCKQCITKGPDGTLLDGCPWDAIDMVPVAEVEAKLEVKYEF